MVPVIDKMVGGPQDPATNITDEVSLVVFLVFVEFSEMHEDFAAKSALV